MVSSQQRLWVEFVQPRVDRIAAQFDEVNWFPFGIGDGTKGPCVYDWTARRYGAVIDQALHRWPWRAERPCPIELPGTNAMTD